MRCVAMLALMLVALSCSEAKRDRPQPVISTISPIDLAADTRPSYNYTAEMLDGRRIIVSAVLPDSAASGVVVQVDFLNGEERYRIAMDHGQGMALRELLGMALAKVDSLGVR